MDQLEAQKIYNTINQSQLEGLKKKVIQHAIRYSRLRVDWYTSMLNQRVDIDHERTIAHNALISSVNALARNMRDIGEDTSWFTILNNDRKRIGDLACYISLFIGIKAR